jgi:hypothetical protein
LERLCTVKKSNQCPYFEAVVLVDGITSVVNAMAKQVGLQLYSFAKVEAVGAQRIATEGHQHRPPSPQDVFTFCYTR